MRGLATTGMQPIERTSTRSEHGEFLVRSIHVGCTAWPLRRDTQLTWMAAVNAAEGSLLMKGLIQPHRRFSPMVGTPAGLPYARRTVQSILKPATSLIR